MMIKRLVTTYHRFAQTEYLVNDSIDEDYIIRECISPDKVSVLQSFAYSLSGSKCFRQIRGDAQALYDKIEEERACSIYEEL